MKCLKKYFLVLAVAILLAASCASGSEGEQAPAPTPDDGAAAAADPTATPAAGETEVPVEEATATAEPIELSDEEMIEAALAAFDANPEPEALIAWDHLDARVSGTEVMLTMCTWTGDTVFDDVRTANYTSPPATTAHPNPASTSPPAAASTNASTPNSSNPPSPSPANTTRTGAA